jgi:hypothetical protein
MFSAEDEMAEIEIESARVELRDEMAMRSSNGVERGEHR